LLLSGVVPRDFLSVKLPASDRHAAKAADFEKNTVGEFGRDRRSSGRIT
jgi:hypothetical protein